MTRNGGRLFLQIGQHAHQHDVLDDIGKAAGVKGVSVVHGEELRHRGAESNPCRRRCARRMTSSASGMAVDYRRFSIASLNRSFQVSGVFSVFRPEQTKEVAHEYDCSRLFILHGLVDFADQHRRSGCRHQQRCGAASTASSSVRRHRHRCPCRPPRSAFRTAPNSCCARASAERSAVDRLQAQIDAFLADKSGTRRGRDARSVRRPGFFQDHRR